MARLPLSVFLIAKNEADRLGRTLDAVADIAGEIVLVDSGSTDATVEIAAARGAKTIVNTPFPGYGEQKRIAEAACAHDWVLNLDADEVVGEALRTELVALFAGAGPAADGYAIPIVDMLPLDSDPAPFAYALRPVRLYRRSHGRYNPSPVHDRVDMAPGARIGQLKAPILHYSIRSLGEHMDKLLRYTTMQADDFVRRGRRVGALRLIVEFPVAFLRYYIVRRYALRGVYGFVLAMNFGFYRFMRVAKIYEKQRSAGR